MQEALAADAASLAGRWDSILRGEGSVGDFKTLAQATHDYLRSVPQSTDTTREQLREIVMAQEFQDLTGQVLKRITELANNLETQLLTLLVENAPAPIRKPETLSLLDGAAVAARAFLTWSQIRRRSTSCWKASGFSFNTIQAGTRSWTRCCRTF